MFKGSMVALVTPFKKGSVDEAGHKVLGLAESGELEAYDHAAVGEAGVVVDVGRVTGFLGRAGDLHDPGVEVGLLELRDAVGRGAFPAVADVLEACAGLVALKGVVEEQGTLGLQPSRVVSGGEGEGEEAGEEGESHGMAGVGIGVGAGVGVGKMRQNVEMKRGRIFLPQPLSQPLPLLGDQFLDDFGGEDAGELLVEALELVRQALMVVAHEVHDRGVEVRDVQRVLDDVVAEVVGLAVDTAALGAAASHPHREAARVVVATVVGHAESALAVDRTAEFSAPDDERVVEHAALLEVLDERVAGAVDVLALAGHAVGQVAMVVPVVEVDLGEADAAFGQAAGHEHAVGETS